MYNMGTLLRNGSTAQKDKYLPGIAAGKLRIQSMAVTEPTTGTDTTKIKTTAVKKDGRYVVNGQKVWISRVQHSDLMILLARTTPLAEVKKKSEGMSIFIVDLHQAIGNGLTVRPIPNLVNHETNELFFDNLEIPEENLIGEEGQGLQVHPRRPERRAHADRRRVHRRRLLVHRPRHASMRTSASCSTARSARTRACSFPIADAFIEIEAANLMRFKAARAVRRAPALRRPGQHGQVSGREGVVGGGQRLHADARRLRLCQRVRHRAQVPRDAPVPGGADLDQPDLRYVAEHVLGLPRSF